MAEKRVIWQPQPKQERALECPAFEVFFGGAAGGGKTDFLLADFLDGVNYGSDHKGILFRKTYPEFEEIVARSRDLYPALGAVYNESKSKWTFPKGATIKFRALERDADVHKYQGHAYTYVAWDELPNWSSSFCYIYMFSRCRSGTGVPCRIRATGNPGSPGHAWVKNRFINNQVPEQLFKDPQTGLTRCFIPSLLDDNLILMKNDPDYEKRLLLLPPHLQRALRFGDWDVFAGQAFEEFRYDQHVVHPFAIEPQWTRFTSMDWGYNKPYAILWWAITGDGRAVIYREMYGCLKDQPNTGTREPPLDVAKRAWEISVAEGCKVMVADPACWSKISDSPSIAESFASAGWQMEKANNDRKSGLMTQHEFLKTTGADGKPMLLIFNTCYDLIRTLPEMVIDAAKPEDIDTTGEDHAVDSMRYGLMSRFIKSSPMYARHKAPKPMKYAKPSRYSINTGLYERYK